MDISSRSLNKTSQMHKYRYQVQEETVKNVFNFLYFLSF